MSKSSKPWQSDPHKAIQSITNPEEIRDWLAVNKLTCKVLPCAIAQFEEGWELFWWVDKVGKVTEDLVRRNQSG